MKAFVLLRWFRSEIGKEVQRAVLSVRKETIACPGQESEDVRFVQAVQIDHQIEPPSANIRNKAKDLSYRAIFRITFQPCPVDGDQFISYRDELEQLLGGRRNENRDLRLSEPLS